MGRKSKEEKINITIHQGLKRYYPDGYSFRGRQEEIITDIMMGRDILAILPTGAGKSICFQLPAFLLPGVTIVVTPLNALMKNQCEEVNAILNAKGIQDVRAIYLNAEMLYGTDEVAMKEKRHNQLCPKDKTIKLVYVSPERLFTEQFQEYVHSVEKISMIVVDEAHCISMWGFHFRPSYAIIPEFYNSLPKRPIIAAFTATATPGVTKDISDLLHLILPSGPIIGEGNRKELHFSVVDLDRKHAPGRLEQLLADIRLHKGELGIIYCITISQVEEVYNYLCGNGIRVGKYHGIKKERGEDEDDVDWDAITELNEEHKRTLEKFSRDEIDCVVATSAFGMGINKRKSVDTGLETQERDVTYVINYSIPLTIEDYYQEAGRGARNAGTKSCDCILYYSYEDFQLIKDCFIAPLEEQMENTEVTDYLMALANARLAQMQAYAKYKGDLESFLKEYFESFNPVLPMNPAVEQWHHRLDDVGPAYLFINNTKLVRNLRKHGYKTEGRIDITLARGEEIHEKYQVIGRQLTYFDFMVLDAIYSIKRAGLNEFSTLTILKVLSGNDKVKVKSPVRDEIVRSIEHLQYAELAYQSDVKKDNEKEIREPILPPFSFQNRKNGINYVYLYRKTKENYNKSFLFRYAERSAKGQFIMIPIEDLHMGHIVPVTKEWLELIHYLYTRIGFLTHVKTMRKVNNSIGFRTLINDLDIQFPVSSKGRLAKERRLLTAITKMLDYLQEKGYILGYNLVEYVEKNEKNMLSMYSNRYHNQSICGYSSVKIVYKKAKNHTV